MVIPNSFKSKAEAQEFVAKYTVRLFRDPHPERATLRLLDFPDGPIKQAVCKDFFDTKDWYRLSVGRFLIAHEYGAYNRLQGITGIPAVYSRPRPDMMILEYIANGDDLWHYKKGELPVTVLEQMQTILREMHSRGVVHLDIGHDSHGRFGRETNFMWNEELQKVYLIDPAGALYGVPLPKFFWKGLEGHDNLALNKIHDFFFPDLEWTPPEPMPKWARTLFTKLKKI